ncbi:MAG TPA: protein translocase subunit SecD [Hyphomicrobiaceae bacterium]|nr:protein translocase subunit SecD [Hyphomicrobiaceae bacterium]
MLHFSRFKMIAILLTCLVSILFALPNLFTKEQLASWPRFLPTKQMPLGLDLQGGAHLLLAMDTEELRKEWLQTLRDDARRTLRDAKIFPTGVGVVGNHVQVRLAKPEEADAAVRELRKLVQPIGSAILGSSADDLTITKGADGSIQLAPSEQGLQQRVINAAGAAIETVNRRINALGTAESTVVRQGADRILVQYPGLTDTKVLKDLLGQTAKLSFHEVHPTMTAEEARQGRVPTGFRIYPGSDRGDEQGVSYLLRETPVVPGENLVDAQPGFDQRTNEPIISFRFDQAGARRFARFTQDHVGRPFAIVLDDKVLSAPVIREPILGGSGQISGSFTVESANTLAVQLRSGALPVRLTIAEERTVGPSLGADSIQAGKLASFVGAGISIIMVIIAYGTFGVFAVIGLIMNGTMVVALMSVAGTTLTLPGIAGLVLTVGMAVDSNVIIYERIREELRAGKSAVSAIDAGFSRAITTILDSQLTTLAAAIIMFWLGSGPIRGFAVTLSIGIFTSIFTAVTVTRLLIALWLRSERAKPGKIVVPI